MGEVDCVGFKHGTIRLEEIPAVYYSGQTINGALIFDLREPLTFSGIYIKYVGEANVLWTESQIERYHNVELENTVKYQAHEEYFNYSEPLAGGIGTSELPRTYQNFPFKFQIPFRTPSSFQGEYGSVTYTITATIVYPDSRTEELKKEFSVVSPLDLNIGNPSVKAPIDLTFEEVYGCGCFGGGDPVTVRIRLPVTGYCPGQTIPVGVEVQNKSNIEIRKIIFTILTKQLYRSRTPPSEYILPDQILSTTKRGAVMARSQRRFTCDVRVPDMLPPNLEHCTVIDVGYFFRVTIKLSGCNDELQDEAEICLGLVPLQETLNGGVYTHPMANKLPSGPIPVNTMPELTVPAPALHGSNLSIHRSQQNLATKAPYQDAPPPYPGNVAGPPYPGNVGSSYPAGPNSYPMKNLPQPSYEIGFKAPEAACDMPMPPVRPPPYTTAVNMPHANPPYPIGNAMPRVKPPYPTGNAMPQVNPPYPSNNAMPQPTASNNGVSPPYVPGSFAPSAPPPTD